MNRRRLTPDRAEIVRALSLLFDPDDVIELRALHRGKKRTDAGYFDGEHRDALADAAVKLNGQRAAVYINLNPLDPQLLGRYANRIEEFASATATDANVIRRRWLLIDLDPARPKDTSATAAQVEAAKQRARVIYRWLKNRGWSDPMVADSGNGMHLLYRIDLPNDDASRDLIRGVLAELARQFDAAEVTVDQSVFNAARICKLYGTVSNKGDHTEAAPWRVSRIVSVPDPVQAVPVERLRELLPVIAPPPRPTPNSGTFDLTEFLHRLGIDYEQDRHEGRDRYRLVHCPFNADHGRGESAIFRSVDGKLGFKCQHNSCADRTWQDVRALVDGTSLKRSRDRGAGTVLVASARHLEPTVELLRADAVKLEPVKWLWQDWLAAGKLHIVAGPPGTGKTTICLALAATITCGGRWPDGTVAERGDVLIWSGEDDPADTLAPRLKASGAHLSRVHFVRQVVDGGDRRPFDPAQDMAALTEAARNLPDLRLLVLDPIVNAVGGDSHKNTEVRRALAPVVDLAASLRVAAVGISHFSKGSQQRDPVERVTGSLAFGALPRVVMAAVKVKTEDGSDSRLLARAKSNIGKDDGGFAYSLEQVEIGEGIIASRLRWGAAVEGSARELLADADTDTEAGGALQDAADWLRDLLADGPVDSNEVKHAADANGIAWSTLRGAKKRIGAKSEKHGLRGGWSWFLPEDAHEDAEDAQQKEVSTFGKPEHLRDGLDEAEVF